MNEPVDRKDLKIQALLEKVSSMTAQYENQLADYRVEITVLTTELQNAFEREQQRNIDEPQAAEAQDEVPSAEAPADDTD